MRQGSTFSIGRPCVVWSRIVSKYLAVPQSYVVNQFQTRELWKAFLTDENGKVFGYDADQKEIKQWLP